MGGLIEPFWVRSLRDKKDKLGEVNWGLPAVFVKPINEVEGYYCYNGVDNPAKGLISECHICTKKEDCPKMKT